MPTLPVALIGLGTVGKGFLSLLQTRAGSLRAHYGLAFRLVCVADSSGVAVNPAGFDPASVREHKEGGASAADLPGGRAGGEIPAALLDSGATMVLEASPVNLETGEPGLGVSRFALKHGLSLVLANKGPLVLAFHELHDLANRHGALLGFSAAVGGPLPIVNMLRRDLVSAGISRIRGVLNITTNFILGAMADGRSYEDALADAQRIGAAETDPTLDVEGWDAANKLVIAVNCIPGVRAQLADVAVKGITELTVPQLAAHTSRGETVKLVAEAERRPEGGYRLSVGLQVVARDDFLAQCEGWQIGIEVHTDIYGTLSQKVTTSDPFTTSAAMLRDAVNLTLQGRKS